MAGPSINLPSSYGGLMRYNEEYRSRFMLKPTHIIIFIILIIVFVAALKIMYPIQ
ncbi:MAG: preprotein translocase subunit Sec61beta [Nanoarchaeota archaeon]|nr:preprotein translocase subunit Sec61beta [Nanoarchaeota archaeon]